MFLSCVLHLIELSVPYVTRLHVMQLYEELYWQNYDTMESNRIELAKQARREALQAAGSCFVGLRTLLSMPACA